MYIYKYICVFCFGDESEGLYIDIYIYVYSFYSAHRSSPFSSEFVVVKRAKEKASGKDYAVKVDE